MAVTSSASRCAPTSRTSTPRLPPILPAFFSPPSANTRSRRRLPRELLASRTQSPLGDPNIRPARSPPRCFPTLSWPRLGIVRDASRGSEGSPRSVVPSTTRWKHRLLSLSLSLSLPNRELQNQLRILSLSLSLSPSRARDAKNENERDRQTCAKRTNNTDPKRSTNVWYISRDDHWWKHSSTSHRARDRHQRRNRRKKEEGVRGRGRSKKKKKKKRSRTRTTRDNARVACHETTERHSPRTVVFSTRAIALLRSGRRGGAAVVPELSRTEQHALEGNSHARTHGGGSCAEATAKGASSSVGSKLTHRGKRWGAT